VVFWNCKDRGGRGISLPAGASPPLGVLPIRIFPLRFEALLCPRDGGFPLFFLPPSSKIPAPSLFLFVYANGRPPPSLSRDVSSVLYYVSTKWPFSLECWNLSTRLLICTLSSPGTHDFTGAQGLGTFLPLPPLLCVFLNSRHELFPPPAPRSRTLLVLAFL